MADIQTTYAEQTIIYLPTHDEAGGAAWLWQGTGRKYKTLIKAQNAIDRANGNNGDAKPKFVKRQAYLRKSWGDTYEIVTVTGKGEPASYRSGDEFWITDGGGKRSKECADTLFAHTPENASKFDEAKALSVKAEALEQQAQALRSSAQSFTEWLAEQEGGNQQ